jgi:hypothetical protein
VTTRLLHQDERRADVDRERRVEVVRVHIERGPVGLHRGAVHEHVESAAPSEDARHESRGLDGVGEVDTKDLDRFAELSVERVEPIREDVGRGDASSLRDERARDRTPDASRCAGDEHHPAVEPATGAHPSSG